MTCVDKNIYRTSEFFRNKEYSNLQVSYMKKSRAST